MNWFRAALGKYADFEGRAGRPEYWYFVLFYFLIALCLALVLRLSGAARIVQGAIFGLLALAFFLPQLAVSVRRLHDLNWSGWWILIALVPYLGGLVLFVAFLFPGTAGPNRFGDAPFETPQVAGAG
jgi:uncharacterized membrane protein YhaH (DUF805 family)